ncbi:hypothetical protein AGOR_G00087300 [Albula goreensis]|uniref:Cysteine-rich motor neuron 1 protein n=1 Tax=Albula goreensis TaxID=1534307 RepID=A0A8T3DJZ7_9TELE|nr:hypothetical protein AGOR_G00087300 [Albula goreensis]
MRALVKCMLLSQLLIAVGKSSQALLCLPCVKSKCVEPEGCPGAVVPGLCGCCSVCAKQRHESCGGAQGERGTCDRGLRCVIKPTPNRGSVNPHEVGVCEDENQDAVPRLDFGPCDRRPVRGCNVVEGECKCGRLWACVSPFRYTSWRTCQSALRRIAALGVDCSGVKCPPVHQVQCPSDSYEAQTGPSADGCCPSQARCQCLPGPCDLPLCPTGSGLRVISPSLGTPGRCCDVFECVSESEPSCVLDGVELSPGSVFRVNVPVWVSVPSQCLSLLPLPGGVPVCLLAQCGTPPCQHHYIPEGECCPVCEDPIGPVLAVATCYANGRRREDGERWREDGCVFCTCAGGEVRCAPAVCGRGCAAAVTVPGECCPLCPEPAYTTVAAPACGPLTDCALSERDCHFGFQKDADGCDICLCQTRVEACRGLTAGCTLDCPSGFQTDDHGCALCQCRPPPEQCQPISCGKDCPHGVMKDKHGCDICRCKRCPELSCDMACLINYQQDDLGCFTCQCRDPPAPSIKPSLLPLATQAEPCLSADGRWRDDGEGWHDGCRTCRCRDGREMCAVIYCPPPTCAYPSIRPGHCCPNCPDDIDARKPEPVEPVEPVACLDSGGRHVADGEAWRVEPCSRCACDGGLLLCETEGCPPALCQNPVRARDSCCPLCPGDLFVPPSPGNKSAPGQCADEEGGVYQTGQSWRPNACSSCVCSDGGAVMCFPEPCPPLNCARPVLLTGRCCPTCLEDATSRAECLFDGKLYADEERWDLDSCTHCYCLQGQTLCSTVSCPALACGQPISAEGSCCPTCSEVVSSPFEKTDPQSSSQLHQSSWSLGNLNPMPQLGGKSGSLQHARSTKTSPDNSSPISLLSPAAWALLSALSVLASLTALLLIGHRRTWVLLPSCHSSSSSSSPKPAHPIGQCTCADSAQDTTTGAWSGTSQHIVWVTKPAPKHSSTCSVHKHDSLKQTASTRPYEG